MAHYQCPLCDKLMERDLLVFNEHTNQHIMDTIKKDHPDWVTKDGACKKCCEHYKKTRNPS